MNPWTVFGVIIAVISLMFAIFVHLNKSLDKKIENKLKDPGFIQKVAKEVRLPFVIFDDEKSIIADTGAMDHIEDIEVRKGEPWALTKTDPFALTKNAPRFARGDYASQVDSRTESGLGKKLIDLKRILLIYR